MTRVFAPAHAEDSALRIGKRGKAVFGKQLQRLAAFARRNTMRIRCSSGLARPNALAMNSSAKCFWLWPTRYTMSPFDPCCWPSSSAVFGARHGNRDRMEARALDQR